MGQIVDLRNAAKKSLLTNDEPQSAAEELVAFRERLDSGLAVEPRAETTVVHDDGAVTIQDAPQSTLVSAPVSSDDDLALEPDDGDSGVGYAGVIGWTGPLRDHHPDMRAIWLVTTGLLGVAVFVTLVQHNLIGGILFALLGGLLILHVKSDLHIGEFAIGPMGVQVHHKFYHYRDIASFWIDYSPEHNLRELSLHLKKHHLPYIKIPLFDENPVQIRSLMIEFVPEIPHQDTLAEILARRLGI